MGATVEAGGRTTSLQHSYSCFLRRLDQSLSCGFRRRGAQHCLKAYMHSSHVVFAVVDRPMLQKQLSHTVYRTDTAISVRAFQNQRHSLERF